MVVAMASASCNAAQVLIGSSLETAVMTSATLWLDVASPSMARRRLSKHVLFCQAGAVMGAKDITEIGCLSLPM